MEQSRESTIRLNVHGFGRFVSVARGFHFSPPYYVDNHAPSRRSYERLHSIGTNGKLENYHSGATETTKGKIFLSAFRTSRKVTIKKTRRIKDE